VSLAESFGKHISLLVVPAGDIFAALVQTANSLDASAVVCGLSTKLSAQEQAYHTGQAWEQLPEPKRQFTFYVVSPNGEAQAFHIGPHVPAIRPRDVQLVHRLWLNLRKTPDMAELHHSDIITYALTRMAAELSRDREGTIRELRKSIADANSHQRLGAAHFPSMEQRGSEESRREDASEKLGSGVTPDAKQLTSGSKK
jgi:hypothetical protein